MPAITSVLNTTTGIECSQHVLNAQHCPGHRGTPQTPLLCSALVCLIFTLPCWLSKVKHFIPVWQMSKLRFWRYEVLAQSRVVELSLNPGFLPILSTTLSPLQNQSFGSLGRGKGTLTAGFLEEVGFEWSYKMVESQWVRAWQIVAQLQPASCFGK